VSLLKENVEQASWVLSELSEVGIDFNEVTKKLEDDGVKKFIASYDQLIKALMMKSSF
jgi:transaldolase